MKSNFRQFGYAIFGLGTSWVRDWYAIKALIISPVTRFRDLLLYLKGWQQIFQKKYILGGSSKRCFWCNRVPEKNEKVFGKKFLLAESFWQLGIFVSLEDFWAVRDFCRSWGFLATLEKSPEWLHMQLLFKQPYN